QHAVYGILGVINADRAIGARCHAQHHYPAPRVRPPGQRFGDVTRRGAPGQPVRRRSTTRREQAQDALFVQTLFALNRLKLLCFHCVDAIRCHSLPPVLLAYDVGVEFISVVTGSSSACSSTSSMCETSTNSNPRSFRRGGKSARSFSL